MQEKKSTLAALSSAAMMLSGLAQPALANPPDQKTQIAYRFTNYSEGEMDAKDVAEGSLERYQIQVHQLSVKTPVSEDTEISLSVVNETMSGASPWYVVPNAEGEAVQVMSGATIDEARNELGMDFRSYNTSSETTLSLSVSAENDYESLAFGYSGQWRTLQQRGTLSWGISGSRDFINATDADIYAGRPVEEIKNRLRGYLGYSIVMTRNRLFGMNIGVTSLDGYLSDAYKLAWVDNEIVRDNRPDVQNQVGGSLMLRQFFPDAQAALHTDIKLYQNDWEVTSESLDLAWYQNLGSKWQLVPSLRYYHQSAATFYEPFYENRRADGFYSSDYRLSEFSAVSARFKVIRQWNTVSVNLQYENYSASGDHPALLSYSAISLGVGTSF